MQINNFDQKFNIIKLVKFSIPSIFMMLVLALFFYIFANQTITFDRHVWGFIDEPTFIKIEDANGKTAYAFLNLPTKGKMNGSLNNTLNLKITAGSEYIYYFGT